MGSQLARCAGRRGEGTLDETAGALTCLTWNVAAVNNNPFEYWVSHDDPAYLRLMNDVQEFIDSPSNDQDVEVRSVFPDALFEELASMMSAEGWGGIEETRKLWRDDFSQRKIMSGFLKDKQLGAKRLASMPDRLTNTVNLFGGGVSCRPTVINNYEPPLPDIATWWEAWKSWMFSLELEVPAKGGGSKKARPCSMLETIPRAKYPALTESEEAISVPLQTLCCAIFDAVLVHMLNSVGPDTWHGVKLSLCKALSTNKVALTLSILEHYSDCDIVFLQECSAAFAETVAATSALEEAFHVLKPAALDHKRDQNSLILLAKGRFDGAGAEEVTGAIEARMKEEGSVTLAKGDLCAYIVPPAASPVSEAGSWLLCSFHGDTDGLASVPLVTAAAAVRAARGGADALRLVIGLDANAHCAGVPGKKLGAAEFVGACAGLGLADCWGGRCAEAPAECCTTFNARTYLQPQLNKAVSRTAAATDPSTDRHPKDYILFDGAQLETTCAPLRDNQGTRGKFDPDAPFPTLRFPSDHAALLTHLRPRLAEPPAAPAHNVPM